MKNQTEVEEFILLGLNKDLELRYIFFAIFLLLYMATLVGNGAIVIVVLAEPCLRSPMYFFLGNLSCLDIFHSTITIPKMLSGFLTELQTISFNGCMVQLFFFYFLGSSEGILLGIRAYDRYVAICNPLHYIVTMKKEFCVLMAAAALSTGFFHALMHTIMTAHLPFCGPNIVEHFICDIKPLLKLACGSIDFNLMLLSIVTSSVVMGPFIFILLSYLYIITFLLCNVQSQSGWQKAFSTCSSHLTVVALLYIPVLSNYMLPTVGNSSQRDMILTLLYSTITPVLNPLIYTLRNREVKMVIRKFFGKKTYTFQ
ncbi:olfactory receptor 12D3-like [Protobothrops mucrosquamatus]|uniref:olfactory receptor 12D3-like n=1 Tax=Protobothrops mucrosquamatus TaxID=103944 RepID=UPI000775CE9A|nr:olfactory receptor 12D3-like [Protobothrops mucrosquamatus]